jgi:Ca2+-binding RTX toxin-like protein
VLDSRVYAGLGPVGQALDPDLFLSGGGAARAADANDLVLYNTRNGALSYDADGSGVGRPVLIAVLEGAPALDAGSILVI